MEDDVECDIVTLDLVIYKESLNIFKTLNNFLQ